MGYWTRSGRRSCQVAQSCQTSIALVDVVRHAQNSVVIVVVVLLWFGLDLCFGFRVDATHTFVVSGSSNNWLMWLARGRTDNGNANGQLQALNISETAPRCGRTASGFFSARLRDEYSTPSSEWSSTFAPRGL